MLNALIQSKRDQHQVWSTEYQQVWMKEARMFLLIKARQVWVKERLASLIKESLTYSMVKDQQLWSKEDRHIPMKKPRQFLLKKDQQVWVKVRSTSLINENFTMAQPQQSIEEQPFSQITIPILTTKEMIRLGLPSHCLIKPVNEEQWCHLILLLSNNCQALWWLQLFDLIFVLIFDVI